uniref:Deoxyribose-phosphate aldolase n=1 Tax=candidate division WOR-3 bacterium TaxID=2052148 RepID=A0A7V3KMR8_UNCW3
MKLTKYEIAQMFDLSAVKANDDESYIRSMVDCARKYRCLAVFSLPSNVPLMKRMLDEDTTVLLGGSVGFPSGGHTTNIKVAEAKELIEMGCRELDMVINIGKLISGRYSEVLDDIKAVIDAANSIPVKVILECHYLNEAQIRKACDLCIEAGASWVKTSTGWAPTGATLENITLIRQHVGNAIGIKAAGGIRDLGTIINLYKRGARRFGLSLQAAQKILDEVYSLPNEVIDFDLDENFE